VDIEYNLDGTSTAVIYNQEEVKFYTRSSSPWDEQGSKLDEWRCRLNGSG
jgi:hypothetical protein